MHRCFEPSVTKVKPNLKSCKMLCEESGIAGYSESLIVTGICWRIDRERERESQRECLCGWKRDSDREGVCEWWIEEREKRERERELERIGIFKIEK